MNERIKELAEQATEYCKTQPRHMASSLWEEKFAELIIAECIKTITEYDLIPGHSAKWEDIYDIHCRLLQDLGEELKEHFGVK